MTMACPGQRLRRLAAPLLLCLLAWAAAPAARAAEIWFGPAPFSTDYVDLFRTPDKWTNARSATRVFLMGPQAVGGVNEVGRNTMQELQAVDAFRMLDKWGIKIAVSVPAVKPWDCSGQREISTTLKLISNVRQAGGTMKYGMMDEPMAGGMKFCNATLRDSAEKTARYMKAIAAKEPDVIIGDIEAYPFYDVGQLKEWVRTLTALGAKPPILHLDVNIHRLDVSRQIDAAADLRAMRDFAKSQGIEFGVILWSGYNPSPTDQAYFNRTMSWAKRVHEAIGAPDQIIVQSWVTRSSPRCSDTDAACVPPRLVCGPSDPPGCGTQAVPNNLPEQGQGVFSHTKLINEVRRMFGAR